MPMPPDDEMPPAASGDDALEDFVVPMPHDRFFRTVFGMPERAAIVLRHLIPPAVSRAADWPSLARVNATYVDTRLGGSESDLLFSLTCAGQPALIYVLFEHQSTVDADMPIRLLGYMVEIWLVDHESLLVDLLNSGDAAGLLRALITYLFSTGGSENASTMSDTVAKLKDTKLRAQTMSYAEHLINQGKAEGKAEGEAHGALVGRVLTLQDLLGESALAEAALKVMSNEQLSRIADEMRRRLPGR